MDKLQADYLQPGHGYKKLGVIYDTKSDKHNNYDVHNTVQCQYYTKVVRYIYAFIFTVILQLQNSGLTADIVTDLYGADDEPSYSPYSDEQDDDEGIEIPEIFEIIKILKSEINLL